LIDVESRAIVRYLEAKYKGQGTELLPTESKALGLAEQGAYIESENFAKPVGGLMKETFFAKFPPLSRLALTVDITIQVTFPMRQLPLLYVNS
jgi:glutathione S-transferase